MKARAARGIDAIATLPKSEEDHARSTTVGVAAALVLTIGRRPKEALVAA